jgi:hypothetical protein
MVILFPDLGRATKEVSVKVDEYFSASRPRSIETADNEHFRTVI